MGRERRELLPPTARPSAEGMAAHPELRRGNTTDTALVTALLAEGEGTLEERALRILPELKGAFTFVFMDEHTLYAARDPQGIRPLVLGRLERGWVIASGTAGLDIVAASYDVALDQLKKSGMQVTEFPAAELDKLRAKMKPVIEKHSEKVGADTVKEVYDTLAKLRAAK